MKMSCIKTGRIVFSLVFVFDIFSSRLSLVHSSPQCTAWLVQSIPTDMLHLPRVSGVLSTGNFPSSSSVFLCLIPVWLLGKFRKH